MLLLKQLKYFIVKKIWLAKYFVFLTSALLTKMTFLSCQKEIIPGLHFLTCVGSKFVKILHLANARRKIM